MRKAIEWMAENHVAANLLMLLIVLAGFISLKNIKQEVFPELELDIITIEMVYRGAAPEDVEQSIVIKIEEAIAGVDGINRITSTAGEGVALVVAELDFDQDVQDVKDLIKTEVDRIITFPEDAEKPVIKESIRRSQVIELGIFGELDNKSLKLLTEKIKEDLLKKNNITQIDVSGVKNYEISIEISEEKLRRYGLTFDIISQAVRQGSLDLPGGKIKTKAGEILIRTKGLGFRAKDYEDIVIRSDINGNTLRIRDVAKVTDGFEESDLLTWFNGQPGALVKVYRVGDQGAIDVADTVKEYVEEIKRTLPEGVDVIAWRDRSEVLRDRIDLLVKNALMGFLLVLISLTLFLDFRLALWVASGIIISFMGSFTAMQIFDVSINVISLFAFILVLGIVVDDAIVVGENIFSERQRGLNPLASSKRGAVRVAVPVVFAVLTTVAAFSPLLFIDGTIGKVMKVIPVIVIAVLLLSLVESLFILPAHISSVKIETKNKCVSFICSISRWSGHKLEQLVNGPFDRLIKKSLDNRYMTIAICFFVLMVSFGFFTSGILSFNFFPEVEGNNMVARLEMPVGTNISKTRDIIEKLENAAQQVKEEYESKYPEMKGEVVQNMYSIIGEQPSTKSGPNGQRLSIIDPAKAEINIELAPSEERDFSTTELMNKWREYTGRIAGIKSLVFQASQLSSGNAVEVVLSATNQDTLEKGIAEVKSTLSDYKGVIDIRDDMAEGKYELKLDLKPEASTLGLSLLNLAKQVRQGFFGEEALRIQRGKDEVKVMIRYPEKERQSRSDIENMRIRTRQGAEVPFSQVATVSYGRGYAAIKRADRARVTTITANVDDTQANANEINKDLKNKLDNKIIPANPGLSYSYEGSQKQQKKSLSTLGSGFIIALFVIYILLAVPFKSYFQPFIIMSAIPFGLIGAFLGHLALGWPLTILSMLGIVALSGVVVNDSLVLVDFINQLHRENQMPFRDAVVTAAKLRFRPILLTSITTFLGLVPIIFEKSLQARFLIPMAISLGFGVVFATAITLLLVPSGIVIIEDITSLFRKIIKRGKHA